MKAKPRWIAKKALLESALARPQNAYAYKPGSTIAELTASYAFGLVKNHPFVDGNKRAAFLSIGMFHAINGYRLQADQVDAIQTMLAVASGELNEKGLAAWIARHVVRQRGVGRPLHERATLGRDPGKKRVRLRNND
jgi:death-on-curing protein